jgi:beta-galactosidase
MQMKISADRTNLTGTGYDLSFVSVSVVDAKGDVVPLANNNITFSITGPGKIASTDNGNPADFVAFPSPTRQAFNGLLLSIIRADSGAKGDIVVTATTPGLPKVSVTLHAS